jgi:hypothetical protein
MNDLRRAVRSLGVLLAPFPYPGADRLVTIATGSTLMHAQFGLSYRGVRRGSIRSEALRSA